MRPAQLRPKRGETLALPEPSRPVGLEGERKEVAIGPRGSEEAGRPSARVRLPRATLPGTGSRARSPKLGAHSKARPRPESCLGPGKKPGAEPGLGGRRHAGRSTPSLHLFISRHCLPRLCHACPALVWPRVLLKGSAPQLGLLGRPNDKS